MSKVKDRTIDDLFREVSPLQRAHIAVALSEWSRGDYEASHREAYPDALRARYAVNAVMLQKIALALVAMGIEGEATNG